MVLFQPGMRGMGEALLENRCKGEVFTGSTKSSLMLQRRLGGCQEKSQGRPLPSNRQAEADRALFLMLSAGSEVLSENCIKRLSIL